MKNKFELVIILLFVLSFAFTACNDWTEIESVTIKEPNIAEQNPELYTKYLENLRQYKKTEHKAVYAWFDNSEKKPFTRAQHLTQLPDSVDVVVLMYPDNLVESELKEMESIRNDKGMKVIYTIDYDMIKATYNKKISVSKDEEPASEDFILFMVDTLQHTLTLADKYNYDGISIGYTGKNRLHMNDKEKKEYKQNENAFIGIMNDWFRRHTNKLIVFEGIPQNLIDKDMLTDCAMILIPCLEANNSNMLTFNLQLAKIDNVPEDKLCIIVPTASPDITNKEIGYFGDGTTILAGVPKWVTTLKDISIAGLGIYNVSNDYYNPSMAYRYTKNVITTLNPSINN